MKLFRYAWQSFLSLVVQYPALISGYVMYAYLFLCIIRFFLLAEAGEVTLLRTYETFIALPFMWLLALSLVKVIEIRSRLHEAETRAMEAHRDLEHKHTQLTTLHEVIRGVQDLVNNPLEVILMKVDIVEAAVPAAPEASAGLREIKDSVRQIAAALARFNRTEEYHVTDVGGGLGTFAVPSDGSGQRYPDS